MPVITAELTQRELEALMEYANQCGETISNIVRKSMIREITLADGYGSDDPRYEYQMCVPKRAATDDRRIIQENYNKIRRILGWQEIKL